MNSTSQMLAIIDFGSQYTRLIARRARELRVHSVIFPSTATPAALDAAQPIGLILSGGPASVYEDGAPQGNLDWLRPGRPVLGVCYGAQWLARALGGRVARSPTREYGGETMKISESLPLFRGLPSELPVWMSHGDQIDRLPDGCRSYAASAACSVAAFGDRERGVYGVQFHPEVQHTPDGEAILQNFLYDVCQARGDWTIGAFAERTIASLRQTVGRDGVLLALSGGVDSMVTAALLSRAVGDRLTCMFVNSGLMRRGETDRVERRCRANGMNLRVIDGAKRFLSALRGVTDSEAKRKTIGRVFIEVFEEEARRIPGVKFLGQGTLYPDVIESAGAADGAPGAIKSHHNVGGLPETLGLKLVEPLRDLFKDEARALGLELGLSEDDVWRQPFPGPGLAVRVLGEITVPRLELLRAADAIVLEEVHAAGWYRKVWQSFAVLLPVSTVGMMGASRTFANVIALRMVESRDGMTAEWVNMPSELLRRISRRITGEVPGVNRVVVDITSKPPATIEWE